ncbi:Vacuolar protein sorting-associated protein 51 homolog [Linum grandiflorum]
MTFLSLVHISVLLLANLLGFWFLCQYINVRTHRISVLLRKRFTTPNWIKHKEPREVHMFVDLFLQEESVLTTIVKLGLKSLQEFVRLQTLNRSGFQQIQLDIQFLRTPLKELSEDEAALDFLLDEVIVGASDRCLDPTPLEPPILDKLIQAKMAGSKDRNPSSS